MKFTGKIKTNLTPDGDVIGVQTPLGEQLLHVAVREVKSAGTIPLP
jgi:hypothetical protein